MNLLENLINANILRTTKILELKSEAQDVKTFVVNDKTAAKAKPGQFLMVWIPGVDEIPLSVFFTEDKKVGFSVKSVGDATKKLNQMKIGEIIGIRGPFGTSFSQNKDKALLIAGGIGAAPLLFLAKQLASKGSTIKFVIGAKTKNDLLYLPQIKSICDKQETIVTTDDGSCGIKCMVTEPLNSILEKEHFDIIYTCGPEKMVRKIFDLAQKYKINLEVSLERLMRCGIGLCGSCVIGKYRVCKEGPIFSSKQLLELKNELGITKLGFGGNRINI